MTSSPTPTAPADPSAAGPPPAPARPGPAGASGAVRLLRRLSRPLAWAFALGPVLWLAAGVPFGLLGANPIEALEHGTGEQALRLLIASLAVTPIRRLTGWTWLQPLRRFLGLAAFWVALLHLGVYAGLDLVLDVGEIVEDVTERPFITVGFAALVILSVLAATSPAAIVKRMGGARWRRLHRLAYVAGILGCVHYLWGVKQDIGEPLMYGAALAVVLAARFVTRQ